MAKALAARYLWGMAPLRPLSVLDLSPVTTGNSGPQALRNSLDLARLADRLGFARYWVAVCDANRARVRSGNLNLIYPGELIVLPALA